MDSIALAAGVLLAWLVLFVLCRRFVLWYFRINEHIELLRDIRSALRSINHVQSAYVPNGHTPQTADTDNVRRRPGEDDDQFNSRVADALSHQFGR